MNRDEYNDLRGWEVPADENPADDGYLVEYHDGGKANHPNFAGYISWSPKEVFERAYKRTDDVGIEQEIQAKGLPAPRVTLSDLKANSVQTEIVKYISPSGQISIGSPPLEDATASGPLAKMRAAIAAPQASEAAISCAKCGDGHHVSGHHDVQQWVDLVWRIARELGCLPSSFVDGNEHLVRKAAALSAQPRAQKDSRVGTNSGHGHVWKRPDGLLAKCGGPAICAECKRDQAQAHPDHKDGDQHGQD